MMKKLISSIMLASFLVPNVCCAQDVVSTLPTIVIPAGEVDPGAAISPMKKGQKAPFTGVLLSPEAVATVITEIKSLDDKIKLEVQRVTSLQQEQCRKEKTDLQIRSDADKKILQSDIDDKLRTINLLEENLKKEQEDRPNKVVWAGLGAAGGIAVTILTAFAISKVTK
jgi:hypothetical protein